MWDLARRSRTGCGWLRAASAAVVLLAAAGTSHGQHVSRYRFEPGERVIYDHRTRSRPLEDGQGGRGGEISAQQVDLWCLDKEPAGWLMLLECVSVTTDGGRSGSEGLLFQIDPRGVVTIPDASQADYPDLAHLFELWPELRPAISAAETWQTAADLLGRGLRCEPLGDSDSGGEDRAAGTDGAGDTIAGDGFAFELVDVAGIAELLGQSDRGRFWFDAARGLTGRVECVRIDRSAGTETRCLGRVLERRQHDAVWLKRRQDEAGRYLRNLAREQRLMDEVVTRPAELEQILDRLRRLWRDYVYELRNESDSPFSRLARTRLKRVEARIGQLRLRAQMAEALLGRVAAQWSLQDAAGRTVLSEKLRDRVSIECFWRSDSLESLRMMATLRRLSEKVAADDLRIVCINLDDDIVRARRAVELCGAGLTHVLGGAPVGERPPEELPLLRVLDRSSRIRRVVIGWRPSLLEEIVPLID